MNPTTKNTKKLMRKGKGGCIVDISPPISLVFPIFFLLCRERERGGFRNGICREKERDLVKGIG
jgi:hypothetical protein